MDAKRVPGHAGLRALGVVAGAGVVHHHASPLLAALLKLSSNEGTLQNSASFPSRTWAPENGGKAVQGLAVAVVQPACAVSGALPASAGSVVQESPDALATHRPAEQQPAVQESPAQHDSPTPPH